jgi:chemotaxis protein CheX
MKTSGYMTATADGTYSGWLPLLELASQEVFEIMLGCRVARHTPPDRPRFEFTALVGFAGPLCGLLSLSSSTQSASVIVSKMLGLRDANDDQQMRDAVGEVANMIAGSFKSKLTGLGDHCMLSSPTVITGSDYSCRPPTESAVLEVDLLFEGAPINVSLEIHN